MKFSEVQSTARAAIAAGSYWSGFSVIADDGLQGDVIKAAIADKCACVVVSPMLGGGVAEQVKGHAALDCDFLVKIKLVPRPANSDADPIVYEYAKDFHACVEETVALLLQYAVARGDSPFQFNPDAYVLSDEEDGTITHNLLFTKRCSF
jgi:hypothetical protein